MPHNKSRTQKILLLVGWVDQEVRKEVDYGVAPTHLKISSHKGMQMGTKLMVSRIMEDRSKDERGSQNLRI